jgi:Fe-S oxidoreductase
MKKSFDLSEANVENCIYCGACFRSCILNAYDELDGMELKKLVSGVTRIAKRGYQNDKDRSIKEFLDRCTLQGYCDKVCPSMVKPYIRNYIAKENIGGERSD